MIAGLHARNTCVVVVSGTNVAAPRWSLQSIAPNAGHRAITFTYRQPAALSWVIVPPTQLSEFAQVTLDSINDADMVRKLKKSG
jgi:hypothetical protein